MKNLHTKRFALAIFAVFAISFLGLAFESGTTVTNLWSALAIAYKTIPIVLVIIGLFVGYAWRWRIFRGWLVPFPDLNGTWQGSIRTTWVDPSSGKSPGPIPAILTIRQTFVRISCVLRTAEDISHSHLADFWLDKDEQVRRLGHSYVCIPSPDVVDRSPPHDGTVVLDLIGDPVRKLAGRYWTSRKTTGTVSFTFREPALLEEFPEDLDTRPMTRSS